MPASSRPLSETSRKGLPPEDSQNLDELLERLLQMRDSGRSLYVRPSYVKDTQPVTWRDLDQPLGATREHFDLLTQLHYKLLWHLVAALRRHSH